MLEDSEKRVTERTDWAQRLDGELAGVCIQLLEDSEKRVTERTDWAQRLDGELAGVRAEREKYIQLLEDSEKRVTERTDWAQQRRVQMASWMRYDGVPIARRFREAGDRAHRLGAAARWRVG